ncbi:MAG: toast rack family protein [Actinomycetota bacterium]|jgi:hypothetical protein|nr:toast rack family protein [Actinomycetota bacterium]
MFTNLSDTDKAVTFSVLLLVVAALFVGSCGTQGVGEMQRESQVVDLKDVRSVGADLRMGAGELNVTGGADALMEADFAYNVADWKPDVSYEVDGDTGNLSVEQGSGQGVRLGGDARNEWDLRFNDEVPTDLQVEMGAGESNLGLDSLTLTGLDLKIGAGQTMVDLTGDYEQDLAASIQGGVGEATIMLPSEIGVRVRAEGGIGKINAEGLDKEGDSYVNDAYGNSEVTVNVEVQGGVGEINLEVV